LDNSILNKYKAVIGLEVHCQLLTLSKIYSADSTAYGSPPNTNVGVISLAHPGTLPRLNKRVVELAIRMGFACNSEISRHQIFDRKNYFYPDLPKGYQITQDRTPVCKEGFVAITTKSGRKNIELQKIHIEEDAGKSMHQENGSATQVDFNRAGVPLIEIVTKPVISTAEDAGAFLSEVRKLVRYLDICDGNMEEGSLRCDANVSVMPMGSTVLGRKVEVKNMNSVRNVQKAIEYEIERQVTLLERGEGILSETRTFNAGDGKTYGMRTKEELNDYRYFPDPDLSPLEVSDEWLAQIRSGMPALPEQLFQKFVAEYSLSAYDAGVLTETKELASYFEQVCRHTRNFKAASNWVMGPVKSYLNDQGILANKCPVSGQALADLIGLIDKGQINFSTASQKVFPEMILNPAMEPIVIARELNLLQESDLDSILPIVEEVIKEFPLKVEEFRNGKRGIMRMFMGEVMKRSKGKADPKIATELLEKKLIES